MRTVKSFTLGLALVTVLGASSAFGAVRSINHEPQEPNVVVRIIRSIKHHLSQVADFIQVPPPAPTTLP